MNIFNFYKNEIFNCLKNDEFFSKNIIDKEPLDYFQVDPPPNTFDFDLSCNLIFLLVQKNKGISDSLKSYIKKKLLEKIKDFEVIEIYKPGFLNIKLSSSSLIKFIKSVRKDGNKFGSTNFKGKFNIEFVSANPTGPLHVGHCRGAIFGDVLANLLNFNGAEVTKEYYINDYGVQIFNFCNSVFLRMREIKFNEKFKNNENLYPGEYIKKIAKDILTEEPNLNLEDLNKNYEKIKIKSLNKALENIKFDLQKLDIKHDNFVSETEIIKKNSLEKIRKKFKLDKYITKGFLDKPKNISSKNWKKKERYIFKTTLFGDDSDRALEKDDGSLTYFANDIIYHSDKISRKYDHLINILGADHVGYVKRINSAVSAISNKQTKITCKVCQLVKLFKNGKPYKMSKRAGEFITIKDLLKEVDKDSIRFMMLNRSNDVEIKFDFDKVVEKNKDNPIFYVQYCFARISSLFRTTGQNFEDELFLDEIELNKYERALLRKVFEWPNVVENSSNKLEPHRIPFYLYDLATLFHSYWSKGNADNKYKFIVDGKIRNKSLLSIIHLVRIILKNGMGILGVSLPNKM